VINDQQLLQVNKEFNRACQYNNKLQDCPLLYDKEWLIENVFNNMPRDVLYKIAQNNVNNMSFNRKYLSIKHFDSFIEKQIKKLKYDKVMVLPKTIFKDTDPVYGGYKCHVKLCGSTTYKKIYQGLSFEELYLGEGYEDDDFEDYLAKHKYEQVDEVDINSDNDCVIKYTIPYEWGGSVHKCYLRGYDALDYMNCGGLFSDFAPFHSYDKSQVGEHEVTVTSHTTDPYKNDKYEFHIIFFYY
jgi:hypothetical protein